MQEFLNQISQGPNSLVEIFSGKSGNILQAFSAFFNLFPYFAIAAIAVLVFNACWSWKLLKPVLAISGAVMFGLVGQFVSYELCTRLGDTAFLHVLSIPGAVTVVCAIIGAVLCYYVARLFLSLDVGVGIMAILAYLIGGVVGIVIGIIVGLIAFVLVIVFFKQIYVFINSVLGMVIAGMIAGLTLTSSVEYSFVGIIAMVVCGLIGLAFGVKLFKNQFED